MAKQKDLVWLWWLKRLLYLVAATMVCAALLSVVFTQAAGTEVTSPAWATPKVMAIRQVSTVGRAQSTPHNMNNLDCGLVTYRFPGNDTMQTGCFTETALGLFDSDSQTAIFNGTDEGLPLLPSSAHQLLVAWPKAMDLVALDNAPTGGSYISLYKNPLAHLQDIRNLQLHLVAKQLTAPPDLPLTDPAGQRLVINPQTLAFSDGGSWMIAETLGGSFVRINLASLDETAFAAAFGSQGSPGLLDSQVAVSSDGRYVAISNQTATSFRVYDLTTCSGAAPGLHFQNCKSFDYRPFVQGQVSGLQSIRHVRFVNDSLLSFEVSSSNPQTSGIYELAPTEGITSLIDYLGLGDSYTSGEGAFNYVADTDSHNNMCHLSAHSYPVLLTRDLFSSQGGHSVACSGAVITDVASTSDSYLGQVRGVLDFQHLKQEQPALLSSVMANFAPGYVAQQRFVAQYQPGVITVSVGGDDIGFGDVVQTCVEPHVSRHVSDGTCFNTYEDRLEITKLIDRTVPQWTSLYKQLLAEAPGARLYAIGYPQVIVDTGDCALNVHLDKSELEFSVELVNYLNNAIKQAAGKAGVTYVDISQALAGHRLCETKSYNVAVNGLTAGKDGGLLGLNIFGKESYHPNALGQALIEQDILKQTRNLTASPATTVAGPDGQAILQAPKTGRVVSTRLPSKDLVAPVVKAGQNSAIKASGAQNGLKAQTIYSVRLDGPTGSVIGTVRSDTVGDVVTSVSLPSNTVPGGHTIDLTGEGQAGGPVDVVQPIYVPASDADSDGDGITDTADSCPGAINSGQDNDRDGTDDVCDPLIGAPPAPTGTSGPSSPLPITPSATGGRLVTNQGLNNAIRVASLPNATNTAQLLGAATTNPLATGPKVFKPPLSIHSRAAPKPFPALRTIHWLPWLLPVVIAWLVLLLIAASLGYGDSRSKTAYA